MCNRILYYIFYRIFPFDASEGNDFTDGMSEDITESNSLGEKHAESSVTRAEV
jgi:hypothetical protein